MARLEDITKCAMVGGTVTIATVKIIGEKPIGLNALKIDYESPNGTTDHEFPYRDCEPTLVYFGSGRPRRYTSNGGLLRLVSEALRIRIPYMFDPVIAVHKSLVDPLPHQFRAVYEEIFMRQPLRFPLAVSRVLELRFKAKTPRSGHAQFGLMVSTAR